MKTTRPFIYITIFLVLLLLTPVVVFPIAPSPRLLAIIELEEESGKSVGSYHALIIGINDYKDSDIPDLKTAVNDAREMAEILRSDYGFTEVVVLLNDKANESNIIRSLRNLATQTNENDSVLIYYAGHGELDPITRSGYWLPYNAKAGDPATYLENGIVQGYIKAMPARHVLVVADSCFSGKLFGEMRDLPPIIKDKFYATLFKEKSRWGMTSGNLTPVSDEGSEGHSIFAYQFLKTLKENEKPYLTPREIYQKIGPIVRNNSEQMPITKPIKNTGDEGGEFLFIRNTIQSKSSPTPPSNQLEDGTDAFDKERKELEAKRRKIVAERRKIQEEQALAKEERKLAEEKRKLEEEKLRLKEEQDKLQTAHLEPPKPKPKSKLSAPDGMVAIPAGEGELTLYLEVNYFTSSMEHSDCDHDPKIENGKNVKDTRDLPCFQGNNKLTLTLTGPKGTQVTLFDRIGYGNDNGYLIIKKNDDRLIWIVDLEAFPDGKWHSIKADMDTGAYDVFYKAAPTFKRNVASIKWGE